jgi:hypothetical protein
MQCHDHSSALPVVLTLLHVIHPPLYFVTFAVSVLGELFPGHAIHILPAVLSNVKQNQMKYLSIH